ncbi:MAG: deoxyribodipyrimidine photo-lyase, partial [Limnohabitans sp.]
MTLLHSDQPVSVVWFKRDLRLHDHAPLSEAAALGPVLAIYIVEPGLWQLPDAALQHFGFLAESLQDLERQLQRLGMALQVYEGEAVQV